MKLVKKIVMGAAVAITAAGLAVAGDATEPKSMTSKSTAELFGNDVDDFMNVNEYQNVQPEHVFGYLGYGDDGTGKINFGLARQFNKFYLGAWFSGNVNGWTIKNEKDDGSTKKDEFSTQHDTTNDVYGKVLFGLNNMGILANFKFTPQGTSNKYANNKEAKTLTENPNFNLDTSVKFGMNLEGKNDRVYKTWAELGLNSKVRQESLKKDGKYENSTHIFEDKGSTYELILNGGTSFDVYAANDITQTIDLELDTSWTLHPITVKKTKDGNTDAIGAFDMGLTFKPAWTLAYEPEESKFGLKTKAELETVFTYTQGNDSTKPPKGDKLYVGSRIYKPMIDLKPSLAVGAIYKVVPEKFQLNAGAKFNVPTVNWTYTKTDTREANSGKVKSTNETGTLKFTSAAGDFKLTSGFTWTPSDKVTVDANWDILNAFLGNNFQTNTDPAAGKFWDNFNLLVFQKIGFLVSVKL